MLSHSKITNIFSYLDFLIPHQSILYQHEQGTSFSQWHCLLLNSDMSKGWDHETVMSIFPGFNGLPSTQQSCSGEILTLNLTSGARSAVIKLSAFIWLRWASKPSGVMWACLGIRSLLCFCLFNLLKCLQHVPGGNSKSHAWALKNLFPNC